MLLKFEYWIYFQFTDFHAPFMTLQKNKDRNLCFFVVQVVLVLTLQATLTVFAKCSNMFVRILSTPLYYKTWLLSSTFRYLFHCKICYHRKILRKRHICDLKLLKLLNYKCTVYSISHIIPTILFWRSSMSNILASSIQELIQK